METLTPTEVAKILKRHPFSVTHLARQKKLPAFKVGGCRRTGSSRGSAVLRTETRNGLGRRAERSGGGPMKLLFVCTENACRSQMAEGFARDYGKGTVEVWSAGSSPRGSVDPDAIVVMQEKGSDLSRQISKGLSQLPNVTWDIVVTMGCADACPTLPARHVLSWNIQDPKGQPTEVYRKVRDSVEDAVKALLLYLPALKET